MFDLEIRPDSQDPEYLKAVIDRDNLESLLSFSSLKGKNKGSFFKNAKVFKIL